MANESSQQRNSEAQGSVRRGRYAIFYSQDAHDTDEICTPLKTRPKHSSISGIPEVDTARSKVFEERNPVTCFWCRRQGHVAAECPNRKPKVVFSRVTNVYKTLELLRPYMVDAAVSRKAYEFLRKNAATMDVVHPSFVHSGSATMAVSFNKVSPRLL